MAETSYFKKYKRDSRVLTTEENFKLGECFTRAPLSIGKARLLVNYDINDEGESLSPRNGYVTTEVDSFFEGGPGALSMLKAPEKRIKSDAE